MADIFVSVGISFVLAVIVVDSLPHDTEYNKYGSTRWFADGETFKFITWLKERENTR